MVSIPRIKESAILRWTDEVYFQRGQKYFEQGAIYDQRRQGMMLKSKCSGTQAPFYRQEVIFDGKGIKSAECSCPVGEGGYCKHVVALLLTWVNDPDSFQEIEAMDAALEKRSKAELIALIKQMLDQGPDLESLLDLPLPAEEDKPLDIKAIRRQAQQAFRGLDYEWGYARDIEKALKPLLNVASIHLVRSDAKKAAVIYQTIVETILDEENAALDDEEGLLLRVIDDCCEGLGKCLGSIHGTQERRGLLQVLFSAYRWDAITIGGAGAADCVPGILTTQTTTQERAEIAEWTREILPKGREWSDEYNRRVLGGLLLQVEADVLDDEAYLKVCRETGRLNDLIERLLKLKRIKDAQDAARAAEDYPLLQALDIFVKHK